MGLWDNVTNAVNWTFGAFSDGIFGPKPKNENGKKPEESKPSDQGKKPLTDSAVYRTPSNPGTRRYLKEHFRKSR